MNKNVVKHGFLLSPPAFLMISFPHFRAALLYTRFAAFWSGFAQVEAGASVQQAFFRVRFKAPQLKSSQVKRRVAEKWAKTKV
jgi:hypothetical protein